jgi:excinuclease UvrABC helicase subunit UvrB
MSELDYLEPRSADARPKLRDAKSADAEIADLEKRMKEAARALEFETAAQLRDRIRELRAMKLFG